MDILSEGDFFGEIAALTASPRTANAVTEGAATLLEAPAATLRLLMRDPAMSRLLLSALTTRLAALSMIDLPRYSTLDAQSLAALRAPVLPDIAPESPIAAGADVETLERPRLPS